MITGETVPAVPQVEAEADAAEVVAAGVDDRGAGSALRTLAWTHRRWPLRTCLLMAEIKRRIWTDLSMTMISTRAMCLAASSEPRTTTSAL